MKTPATSAFPIGLLLLGLALTSVLHAAAPDKPNGASPLSITGEITKIQTHETEKMIDFELSLNLHFINRSSHRVLLFVGDSKPSGASWPLLVSESLADSMANVYLRKYLDSWYTGPANDILGWAATGRKLDQLSPPAELVHVIEPGESWDGQRTAYLEIEKEHIIGDDRHKLWRQIKDVDPLWLQVGFMTWSNNLSYNKFGERLQKRWEEQGDLVIDYVVSEPIPWHLPVL